MGDGLLRCSGVETLTGAASSTSLSLGQEDSGIIWKFCFEGWKLSWDLRSRLTYSLLGGTKSISLGLLTLPSLSLVLGPCHLCRPKKE